MQSSLRRLPPPQPSPSLGAGESRCAIGLAPRRFQASQRIFGRTMLRAPDKAVTNRRGWPFFGARLADPAGARYGRNLHRRGLVRSRARGRRWRRDRQGQGAHHQARPRDRADRRGRGDPAASAGGPRHRRHRHGLDLHHPRDQRDRGKAWRADLPHPDGLRCQGAGACRPAPGDGRRSGGDGGRRTQADRRAASRAGRGGGAGGDPGACAQGRGLRGQRLFLGAQPGARDRGARAWCAS